ncbi:unnamed protein product [Pleuronectes platessa]|uniref:Uncharacterized protein n=1 Tax=Pleuronectes platessa TaxID=8262 RepID=A0A9N7YAW8_PLEPL|nr:unnamed protein product [Pleuronectes platessa]
MRESCRRQSVKLHVGEQQDDYTHCIWTHTHTQREDRGRTDPSRGDEGSLEGVTTHPKRHPGLHRCTKG